MKYTNNMLHRAPSDAPANNLAVLSQVMWLSNEHWRNPWQWYLLQSGDTENRQLIPPLPFWYRPISDSWLCPKTRTCHCRMAYSLLKQRSIWHSQIGSHHLGTIQPWLLSWRPSQGNGPTNSFWSIIRSYNLNWYLLPLHTHSRQK